MLYRPLFNKKTLGFMVSALLLASCSEKQEDVNPKSRNDFPEGFKKVKKTAKAPQVAVYDFNWKRGNTWEVTKNQTLRSHLRDNAFAQSRDGYSSADIDFDLVYHIGEMDLSLIAMKTAGYSGVKVRMNNKGRGVLTFSDRKGVEVSKSFAVPKMIPKRKLKVNLYFSHNTLRLRLNKKTVLEESLAKYNLPKQGSFCIESLSGIVDIINLRNIYDR